MVRASSSEISPSAAADLMAAFTFMLAACAQGIRLFRVSNMVGFCVQCVANSLCGQEQCRSALVHIVHDFAQQVDVAISTVVLVTKRGKYVLNSCLLWWGRGWHALAGGVHTVHVQP